MQVGAFQVGAGERRFRQVCPAKDTGRQVGVGEVGAVEPGVSKVRPLGGRPLQVRVPEMGVGKVRPCHNAVLQLRSFHNGVVEVDPFQYCPAQVGLRGPYRRHICFRQIRVP